MSVVWHAFHTAPDPCLILNENGTTLALNRRALEFFRASRERLTDAYFLDLFEPASRSVVEELMRVEWSGVGEHRLHLKDNRTVTLNVSTVLLEHGVHYQVSFRDETARLARERTLDTRRQIDGISRLSAMLYGFERLHHHCSGTAGLVVRVGQTIWKRGKQTFRHCS